MYLEQLGLLALAMLLGAVVGAEREFEGKPAGMRTHAAIAVGAALFVLAGRFGFEAAGPSFADPARVAAQVVSGIGFLGAGVIFFHRNLVHGMTTAASIWSTTAIAMACGAGLPWLAVGATGLQLVAVLGLNPVEGLIGKIARRTGNVVVTYTSGSALAASLAVCTRKNFSVTEVSTERTSSGSRRTKLTVTGRGSVGALTTALSDVDDVLSVTRGSDD
ncbi:MAG: MgtC/SapB family protein [Stackebrandtia sp.]